MNNEDTRCPIEQTTLKTQRLTGLSTGPHERKPPSTVKCLVEDMAEVFGPEVSERNRGWFYRIAQRVQETSIYEALSWIKQALHEAQDSGGHIQSPSALFTWHLRTAGAPI